jgi:flagellar motor switch protein FliN/FliY
MADDPAPPAATPPAPAESAAPPTAVAEAPPAAPPAAEVAAAAPPTAAAPAAVNPSPAPTATAAPPDPLADLGASADALNNVDADLATAAASIDELLKQANFDDPSAIAGGGQSAATQGFELPNFQQAMQDAQVSSIDLLRDVELNVKIELGRSHMLVEDVLKLAEGSVVELDKLAGDPVDVFVNERLVARGEVLVLNDNFCVRVNEIVAGVKEEG